MNATAYCSFARKRFMGPKIIIYRIKLYVLYDTSMYDRVYTPPMMHQCTGPKSNPFQKSAYDLDRSPVKSRTSTSPADNNFRKRRTGWYGTTVFWYGFHTRFTRKPYRRPFFFTTQYNIKMVSPASVTIDPICFPAFRSPQLPVHIMRLL